LRKRQIDPDKKREVIFHMSVRNRIKADLLLAMKASESATVATLRTMLAALDNAEAVPLDASFQPLVGQSNDVPRKVLSEKEFLQVLHNEANGRRTAVATYEQLGKVEEANRLRAELAVFAKYLGDIDANARI
jgi:uncharacterized protein YqeY